MKRNQFKKNIEAKAKSYAIILLLVIASTSMVFLYSAPPARASFADGTGSVADPYQITHIEHLYAVRNYLDSNFTLMNNLDFDDDDSYLNTDNKAGNTTGNGWLPIGTEATPFTGTFHGNAYTISNLFISRTSTDYVGLFGYIEGSTIRYLGVVDADIHGQDNVGPLTGVAYGLSLIEHCHATGNATGLASLVTGTGGLVGTNLGSMVTFCYANTTVISTHSSTHNGNAGGLVGVMVEDSSSNWPTINNSYALGNVRGHTRVGGLVGNLGPGYVYNSFARGNVEAVLRSSSVVGIMVLDAVVNNTYGTGTVTRLSGTNGEFGTFTGRNSGANAFNSYTIGSVHYTGTSDPTNRGWDGNPASATNANNFFDTETTGQTTGLGATAKTTAEMMNIETYSAWDIVLKEDHDGEYSTAVWYIDNGSDYPRLWFELDAQEYEIVISHTVPRFRFSGFPGTEVDSGDTIMTIYTRTSLNSDTCTDIFLDFSGGMPAGFNTGNFSFVIINNTDGNFVNCPTPLTVTGNMTINATTWSTGITAGWADGTNPFPISGYDSEIVVKMWVDIPGGTSTDTYSTDAWKVLWRTVVS
jgi:hypothetical protein